MHLPLLMHLNKKNTIIWGKAEGERQREEKKEKLKITMSTNVINSIIIIRNFKRSKIGSGGKWQCKIFVKNNLEIKISYKIPDVQKINLRTNYSEQTLKELP
ncbi:hypothetical protein V6Z11_A03G216500 [Gossypium hirsutum]